MESRLYSLPIELLKYILKYLRSKEIGILDIATTNRNERNTFLKGVEKLQLELETFPNGPLFDSEIRWFVSRKIHLSALPDSDLSHPCFIDLIKRINMKIRSVTFYCHQHHHYYHHQLFSTLGKCLNLKTITIMGDLINDCDIVAWLKDLKKLRDLSLYSCRRISSRTVQSLPLYCPSLEALVLTDIPCVSDQELRILVEGLPLLTFFSISKANITDSSMPLIAKTNKLKEIVSWDDCPRVTWEGKLSYARELLLPQLYSADKKQQTRGIKGFTSLIPFQSEFPINQFMSMGVFVRIQEIVSGLSVLRKEDSEVFWSAMMLFQKLVDYINSADLIQSGYVETMINLRISGFLQESLSLRIWLETFLKLSKNGNNSHYLVSKGLITTLMTLPLDMTDKFEEYSKIMYLLVNLSSQISNPSLPIESWFSTIPFLTKRLQNRISKRTNPDPECTLINLIAMNITQLSHLNHVMSLGKNESNSSEEGMIVYLTLSLQSSTNNEIQINGLKAIIHFKTIDPNFINTHPSLLENLMALEMEVGMSSNQEISSLLKQIL